MEKFIKKNISIIIAIFILLQPLLDLLTGLCIHTLKINLTVGIIVRVLFLLFIVIIVLFIYKKKKLIIPYLIIGLYSIMYIIGMVVYKDGGLFQEIQGLVKTFYFPIMLLSLYSINDEIKISKMTLFTSLYIYLILIFIPTIFGIGYKTYEITKAGTLGFFNSANEISGIISILTPVMFIILFSSKKIIPKIILAIMYLVVILMMGTKTPLLSLILTVGLSLLYLLSEAIRNKKFKVLFITLAIAAVCSTGLIVVIPKTNFYKNIDTHLKYLKVKKVTDVFKDEKLIDHFIFSQRLTFLKKKANLYHNTNFYNKAFGMGYLKNNKNMKLIEMDYFDIYYNHGFIGFIIFASIMLYVFYKTLKNTPKETYESYMIYLSALLIVVLSFITGHIITAPSVDIIVIIIILSLLKRNKKDLLFASLNMDLGGIEKALLNMVNRIDKEKYNVEIVLEEKKGIFLDKINKDIIIREVKVSNNDNVIIRKLINASRKLIFKIFNYNNYDFSCCYTTYSFSSSKLALMASTNTAFYIHSDYEVIYPEKNDFYNFFEKRNIRDYKNILFVSNESEKEFIKRYKDLEDRCRVFNNFIDIKEIKDRSNEKINVKKNKNQTVFAFVGRLDDCSKKVLRQIRLVKEIPSIDLWIIGDGPDRKMYEDEVKRLELDKRVTFFGKKDNPFPYMKEADYIILTSDYEGFSVTLLEAVALNKNIITTVAKSDDIIDMKNLGYLVSKDEKEMTKQVKSILSKKTEKSKINFEKVQEERMKKLEEMFNE